ncbi:MAG: BrnT family toxin [Deltaproteobacteria bacterium]|nr:BrnT family toxin [Deltaproteobacteria bacterium]
MWPANHTQSGFSGSVSNFKKHRIDFADAVTVFDDHNSVTIDDPDHGEPRFNPAVCRASSDQEFE